MTGQVTSVTKYSRIKMSKLKYLLLFAALALVVLSAVAFEHFVAGEESSAAATAVPGSERPVAAGRGRVDVEGGMIQIAAQRDGVIAEVFVTEGAEVRAGDLLARQDDRTAQTALAEANAALAEVRARGAGIKVRLAASRRERNRLEGLRRDGAEASKSFDEAQSRLDEAMAETAAHDAAIRLAEARVATAAMEVSQREIRSPVDGRIVRLQARPGTGASTLQVSTLFTLVPHARFLLRVDVEERALSEISIGQRTTITLDGNPEPITGEILRIGEILGQRRIDPTDTQQRVDERVVEVVVSLPAGHYRIGQRGLAKFESQPSAADRGSKAERR